MVSNFLIYFCQNSMSVVFQAEAAQSPCWLYIDFVDKPDGYRRAAAANGAKNG